MRLEKLKLAGFKSFVDPTTIPFPNDLTAIVGPNGCGKSNIIDAIRWVMGELSSKNLRGESNTDMIFNGSSTRKPVGQASVELVFDNSDGRAGGEYAGYAQLAIKRSITRDGQSNYYLNNTRCRRKDIMDIFLGTGLGPRSYSIIEQGTISRLIEAKPEELRIFLEEAAGISKYKERRRETENRIRHTRDNLERLTDIRDELDKQIQRLNRQAKAAEKYTAYREEERLYQAQLHALRFQVLKEKLAGQDTIIKEHEVQFEACIAEQRHCDTQLESIRAEHDEAQEAFNTVQSRYYELGSDIARLEEAIAHQRQRRQQLQDDLTAAQAELSAALAHLSDDEREVLNVEQVIAHLAPEVADAKERLTAAQENLSAVEKTRETWQDEWDDFNTAAAESAKAAQVEQTRIQHLEEKLQQLQQRMEKLQEEQREQELSPITAEIDNLQQQYQSLEEEYQQQEHTIAHLQSDIQTQRQSNQEIMAELDGAKTQWQSLQGRHASLEALQQAALGKQNKTIVDWLEAHDLANKPRLAEQIQVRDGFDHVVEMVLGDYLQAVCVDDLHNVSDVIHSLTEGNLMLVDARAPISTASAHSRPLSEYVITDSNMVKGVLSDIYVADSLSEALTQATQLAPHQSIVTPDGLWIGQGWLRVAKETDATAGVLQREQELKELQEAIKAAEDRVEEITTQLTHGRDRLTKHEEQRDSLQAQLAQLGREQSDCRSQLRIREERIKQIEQRTIQINADLADLDHKQQQAQESLQTARQAWQVAMESMDADADKRDDLTSRRDDINHQLESVNQLVMHNRELLHQKELDLQTKQSQVASLKQNIDRDNEHITNLQQRTESLTLALEKVNTPDIDLDAQLAATVSQHATVDNELQAARQRLNHLEHDLKESDKKRTAAMQNAQTIQGKLEHLRVEAQTHRVRLTTIQEQLDETDFTLEALIQDMPEEANEPDWQAHVEELQAKIQRLGLINLAAIEEYKIESERKFYLDAQNDDLTCALDILENAISKIDKETRTRFRETYDQVNDSFKALFPSLFGGGNAYLELTGDDLLNTGVSVIARPPGKRNSSIHMLSGGEKAMTAVALVMSIFRLNPSPFCLLDEVDAPLDDANVGRFCKLISEMTDAVQFVVITHNKVTMEMAQSLAGVTMHEAGVSRIVAVDVDEAVSLAEA